MDYDRLFAQFDSLQECASVDAVYGEPVQSGDKIVIPVASLSYAFGLGFGQAEDEPSQGGGGGGGLRARPVAVIEVTPERTHVEGIVDEQRIVLAGIAFAAWAAFWMAIALVRIFARPGR